MLTGHAKRIFCDNVTCFGTNRSLEQVGIDISAPCTRESKNKFGSKCDAFGADMSSRMSAPGISCSKKTVLRIGFMMDHHRDYWARCNMCSPQNEAGWFAYASWIEVLLHVFAWYRSLQGRPEAQGFRKLATLQGTSFKFCQEEEKASGSLSSSIDTRIRIGSSSQWIITVAILRPVQWFRPSPNMGSKDSLMHHNKACCCMLLWNLGSVQGRPGAQGFRKLAPLRMSAFISCPKQLWGPFLTSLPRKARHSFEKQSLKL